MCLDVRDPPHARRTSRRANGAPVQHAEGDGVPGCEWMSPSLRTSRRANGRTCDDPQLVQSAGPVAAHLGGGETGN